MPAARPRSATLCWSARRHGSSRRCGGLCDDLSGSERIITAITVALNEIRSDPLGQLMINSIRGAEERTWLTESPTVAGFATDLNGLTEDDTAAAQWIVRVVLSLLYWPIGDGEVERQMLQRFVSPAFAT